MGCCRYPLAIARCLKSNLPTRVTYVSRTCNWTAHRMAQYILSNKHKIVNCYLGPHDLLSDENTPNDN